MNKLQIIKQYPDLYEEIIKFPGTKFNEQRYNYEHNITKIPCCPICGKEVIFQSASYGYRKYCSNKCAGSDKSVKEKRADTCKQKYGVEFVNQNQQIQQKTKATCKRKYGVEFVLQDPSIKRKKHETMLSRYGYDGILQTTEVIKKKIETNRTKYGVDWHMQTVNYRNKIRNSIREKTIINIPDVIGYAKGGDWICRCPHENCNKCSEKTYITNSNVYGSRKGLGAELCTNIQPIQSKFSSLEVKIRNWLDEMEIEYITNDRQFGMEMDVYIPSLQLAIEVNGSYWHSTQFKSPSYHIQKSILLAEKGVRVVFVWDDYLEEDIHEFLKAVIEGEDLNPWVNKWFPDVDGWPADFGLIGSDWKEHKTMHGGFECYDAGEIIKKEDR